MTNKVLLSLILATCVCSGTGLVQARQPKTTVAPAKTSTSQPNKTAKTKAPTTALMLAVDAATRKAVRAKTKEPHSICLSIKNIPLN